jgi:hypothetical protein
LLKPSGTAATQAARLQPAVQLLEGRVALALEQLADDGAGVLGIEIDRPARERLLEDAGIAQALPVYRRRAGGGQCPGDDLAQDVRLGETLRADDDGRLLRRRGRRADGQDCGGDEDCL